MKRKEAEAEQGERAVNVPQTQPRCHLPEDPHAYSKCRAGGEIFPASNHYARESKPVPGSEQVCLKTGDEMNARNVEPLEGFVVRDEELDTGFGRAGEMDGVGGFDRGAGANDAELLSS